MSFNQFAYWYNCKLVRYDLSIPANLLYCLLPHPFFKFGNFFPAYQCFFIDTGLQI